MRSRSPLRRRRKGPMQYARPKSGSRQAEAPRPAAKQFRISSPSLGPVTRTTRRWWADLLEEEEEQRLTSLRSGAELRVVDPEEVVSGVTIEYSLATDQEEGPDEPDPAADRVFIITKKGEHYLHVTPAGTSEADIARQLQVAQDTVKSAVDVTRRTVEQACAHAEEATT